MDIRYGVHHGVGEEQCSRLYEKRTHMWNNAVNSFRKGLTCAHQQMLSMKMKVQYHSKEASHILRGIKLNVEFSPMHLYFRNALIDAGVNVIAARVRVTVPGSVRNAVDSY